MANKLYIAAYDVRHPPRLARALRVVRSFASGGQKSVHECWLDPLDERELLNRMAATLDLTTDSFALVPLTANRPVTTLGIARAPIDADYFYLA